MAKSKKRSQAKRSGDGGADCAQYAHRVVEHAIREELAPASNVIPMDRKEEQHTHCEPEKNQAAVALGRLGGLRGGRARADRLSPERRHQIASAAARKRWSDKP